MVPSFGWRLKVTPVMGIAQKGRQMRGLTRGQDFANPAEGPPLFFTHFKELKSAVQSVRVPHDRPQLNQERSDRDGKLDRDNLARLEFTGQRRSHSILSHFAGAAPQCARDTVTKDRGLDANVHRVPGITPHLPMDRRRR